MWRITSASFRIWRKVTDALGNLLSPSAIQKCLKLNAVGAATRINNKMFASTNLKLLEQMRLYAYLGLAVYFKMSVECKYGD